MKSLPCEMIIERRDGVRGGGRVVKPGIAGRKMHMIDGRFLCTKVLVLIGIVTAFVFVPFVVFILEAHQHAWCVLFGASSGRGGR